ncbi:hypothetical protein B0T14DRAFT_439133 [Immersiella caudata]|uniref:C2H2-type domain-containing protein n=1 Tax=Immersiella caudata TaxID=314043 RepID=A0AA39WCV2_9PEZI|nr:hypothetical protein B0T14DRAFT_439133 [Immersiella caudata]
MFECGTCGKEFPAGWAAREKHCRSTSHLAPELECDRCDAWFGSSRAKFQHMEAKNHFAWKCRDCEETYPTQERVVKHENEEHHYCNNCDRCFTSLNGIQMHLKSGAHLGDQGVQCPYCKDSCVTATGLVHHLERRSCPVAPFVGRDDMYYYVRSKDPKGLISKKLIGGIDNGQLEATDKSWNGRAFECYFCHRTFGGLSALNQHLKSGTHSQNLYHCLNTSCGREFKTLAATINHLESESCSAISFDTVQRNIADIVSGGRMICFR